MRRSLVLVAAGWAAAAHGQAPPPSTVQRGGLFVEPPAQVDPVYVPQGPDGTAPAGAAEPRLVLRLSSELPLRRGGAGSGTQGGPPATPTLQATLRWHPLDDRRWFLQGTFLRYVQPDRQRPWDPDVHYAFGFEDARPGGWSAAYANYTGTRLRAHAGAPGARANFPQGQWTLRRHFALPQALEPLFLAGDGDQALCHAEASWSARYATAAGAERRGKASFALGCRYSRPDGWFAHATAFGWPGGVQQPWDPDFTYGAGWTSPSGWTVQYANHSGNRWPGRPRAPDEGSLASGTLSLSWTRGW